MRNTSTADLASSADSGQFLRNRFSAFLIVILLLAFVANVAILLLRLRFVITASDLFETTGTEGVGIYAVWKVKNGFPLYEWPDRANYALSIFNYQIYLLYGSILRLFNVADAHTPSISRLITLAFTLVGAFVHRAVIGRLAPAGMLRRAGGLMATLVVASLWIGRAGVNWWSLTVRPDLPALCMVMCGMWLLVGALDKQRVSGALIAAVMFYLAWTLKQSCLLTLFGCFLFLLWTRRFRMFVALCLPFVILCAATLLIGGPIFRRNTVFMCSLPAFSVRYGLVAAKAWIMMNPIIWFPPIIAGWAWRYEAPKTGTAMTFDSRQRLMLVAILAAVTLPLAMVGICRVGASDNYFFEPMTHLSCLGVVVMAWCMESGSSTLKSMARFSIGAFASWWAVFAALTLAFPNGPSRRHIWNLDFREVIGPRRAFFDALAHAPRPLMTEDNILAQPWWATNDTYPALVTDREIFQLAQDKGVIPEGVKSAFILKRNYGSIVARADSELARAAIKHGFEAHSLPMYTEPDTGTTSDAEHQAPMILFTRPPAK